MSEYKLVPVVPTVEMAFSGVEVYGLEDCADADVHSIWEAMLSAVQPHDLESVWMYKGTDGDWKPFMNEQHRLNTIAVGGWEVREFFTTPALATQPTVKEMKMTLTQQLEELMDFNDARILRVRQQDQDSDLYIATYRISEKQWMTLTVSCSEEDYSSVSLSGDGLNALTETLNALPVNNTQHCARESK